MRDEHCPNAIQVRLGVGAARARHICAIIASNATNASEARPRSWNARATAYYPNYKSFNKNAHCMRTFFHFGLSVSRPKIFFFFFFT